MRAAPIAAISNQRRENSNGHGQRRALSPATSCEEASQRERKTRSASSTSAHLLLTRKIFAAVLLIFLGGDACFAEGLGLVAVALQDCDLTPLCQRAAITSFWSAWVGRNTRAQV